MTRTDYNILISGMINDQGIEIDSNKTKHDVQASVKSPVQMNEFVNIGADVGAIWMTMTHPQQLCIVIEPFIFRSNDGNVCPGIFI